MSNLIYRLFLRYQWQKMQKLYNGYRIMPILLLAFLMLFSFQNSKAQKNIYFQKKDYTKKEKNYYDYYILELDTVQQKGMFYLLEKPFYHRGLVIIGFKYDGTSGLMYFVPNYYVYEAFSHKTNNIQYFKTKTYREYDELPYYENEKPDGGNSEFLYYEIYNYGLKRDDFLLSYSRGDKWEYLSSSKMSSRMKYYTFQKKILRIGIPSSMDRIKKIKWKNFSKEQQEIIKEYRAKYFSPSFNINDE